MGNGVFFCVGVGGDEACGAGVGVIVDAVFFEVAGDDAVGVGLVVGREVGVAVEVDVEVEVEADFGSNSA